MQDLAITVIQSKLEWENVEKNLTIFEQKIKSISDQTDVLILPEMFTTGFTMNAVELAERPESRTLNWMRKIASNYQLDIVGSFITYDKEKYFNRLHWVKQDGQYSWYDKRHLFRMANEHEIYSSGSENILVDVKGWKLRPFICYDLRFPVWARNVGNEYDVAIYIANWPERRSKHWITLLQARAIENQCYTVGVNRIGHDGLNINYCGDSLICDPLGNKLVHLRKEECNHTERLKYELLARYRQKFPAWMDRDRFDIID